MRDGGERPGGDAGVVSTLPGTPGSHCATSNPRIARAPCPRVEGEIIEPPRLLRLALDLGSMHAVPHHTAG